VRTPHLAAVVRDEEPRGTPLELFFDTAADPQDRVGPVRMPARGLRFTLEVPARRSPRGAT